MRGREDAVHRDRPSVSLEGLLEQQAWIKAEWRPTETGRMAKFYSLTKAGRTQLEKELESWTRLSGAINLVIQES
jgi:DNA-binding PadR family transcriptional regulator